MRICVIGGDMSGEIMGSISPTGKVGGDCGVVHSDVAGHIGGDVEAIYGDILPGAVIGGDVHELRGRNLGKVRGEICH